MNIYEFAMQMEQDGERFYRDLASKSNNPGVAQILNMLADDEVKHYNIVKALAEKSNPSMAQTSILKNARNVFAGMTGAAFDLEGLQVELFAEAKEIEKQSQEFYTEKAEQVDDPAAAKVLLQIAEEEQRHYYLIDNMVEFMDRPFSWVEDAEFTRLDDY